MDSVYTKEGLNADIERSHVRILTETKAYVGIFMLPSKYLGGLTK